MKRVRRAHMLTISAGRARARPGNEVMRRFIPRGTRRDKIASDEAQAARSADGVLDIRRGGEGGGNEV